MAKHNVALNGILSLPLGEGAGFGNMIIVGGPFANALNHPNVFGINLKAEQPHECDFHLPIQDYSVPSNDIMVREAIKESIDAAIQGRLVWAGCMGGMGRTGLFLAILAKAVGFNDPVAYVRKHYYNHAVETAEQAKYVEAFDVSWVPDYIERSYNQFNGIFLKPVVSAPPVQKPTFKERMVSLWRVVRNAA